jgi:hypothetical protein
MPMFFFENNDYWLEAKGTFIEGNIGEVITNLDCEKTPSIYRKEDNSLTLAIKLIFNESNIKPK